MVVLGEIVDAAEIESGRVLPANRVSRLMEYLAAQREIIGDLSLQ